MNTENNKLIAEFMGWLHSSDAFIDSMEMGNLKYHTSWDWLMPVVEKIEGLGHYSWIVYSLYDKIGLSYQACIGKLENKNCHAVSVSYNSKSKIEATYSAVVQFIQWYNQNPHP